MARTSTSSDDQPLEDEANVKLLPMDSQGNTKSPQIAQQNPSTSATSHTPEEDGESRDVGKRIEQVLQNDRSALSESFNLDLEDGDSVLALSDADDDDYGMLLQKDQHDTYAIEEQRGWRSNVPEVLRGRPWWQVGLLFIVGLLLMVFTANGLRSYFFSAQPPEFVCFHPRQACMRL